VLFDLLEIVGRARVPDLVATHLGERPALSAKKTTLRRVTRASDAQWHQDGAFMGTDIRTVNLWLALSNCGEDAPGLDILPRRLDHIVERGTPGAIFDWAASPAMVERAAEGTNVCRPVFEPGDALLFDHMFMHRTAAEPDMTRDRHAVEMWFFAPSLYPDDQVPLVV
jgi:ectoine hydroxylase-related dioxygenase (phytanoyl-CoA dioxygenase family)